MGRAGTLLKLPFLAASLCILVAAAPLRVGDIEITKAWARPTVPSANEGVAYLTISNHGKTAEALIGVSTPAAKRAELHTSETMNGMMQMRAASSLEIPPAGTLALEPGGDHIMLLGLAAPLKRGDNLELTLIFQHQGKLEISVPIMDASP